MKNVRPKAVDLRALRLSPEEGFVLSRVDGPLSMRELSNLTGLDEGRVAEIVGKLASQGAIDVDGAEPPSASVLRAAPATAGGGASSSSSSSSKLQAPASSQHIRAAAESRGGGAAEPEPIEEAAAAQLIEEGPVGELIEEDALGAFGAADEFEGFAAALPEEQTSDDDPLPSSPSLDAAEIPEERPSRPSAEEEEGVVKDPGEKQDSSALELDELETKLLEQETKNERAWRKIYETVYHKMERDGRIAAARTVDGAHLMAMCLDPEPQIVFALLSNPKFGLDQARFLAFHHRTSVGIEMLARNSELLKDTMVQRRLLRNPQLPDMILRKIVNPKLLLDTYKIAIDREVPERSRVKTAELMRRKFTVGGGEEKAALVVKTEGRVLIMLTNCAFDAQMTQILCAKTGWSVLLIQNLARWPATPPALLRHLLKQPVIRQNFGIRKMILKHPNLPSDVKRAFMQGN